MAWAVSPNEKSCTRLEQIGRRARAVVKLGKAYLGLGVDGGLLVGLGAAVTWMLAFELALRFLLGYGLSQHPS